MGKYVIRPEEIATYHPAAHRGTVNRRLVGEENVGAKYMEVVLGMVKEEGLAEPHFHDVEQVMYLLEGKAFVEVDGVEDEMNAGDTVFLHPGSVHRTASIGGPTKWLLIYAPPLGGAGQKEFKRPKT